MNWIDIIILVILAINSLIGIKDGFIVSIFNLVGFIIAYFVAKLYYPVVSEYIVKNPELYGKLKDFVISKVQPIIEKNTNLGDGSTILDNLKLPELIMDNALNNPLQGSYLKDMTDTVLNVVAETLTGILINIISFLIVFFVSWLILLIVVRVIDRVASLPILKQFNKLLGLGVGFIRGALIVYLILAILTPMISFSPDGAIAKGVFDSKIGYYLYNNNILLNYLKEYWAIE